MEDGTNEIEISLMPGGTASLVGFHETTIEGEWKAEKRSKKEELGKLCFSEYRLALNWRQEDGLCGENEHPKTGKTVMNLKTQGRPFSFAKFER